VPWQKSAYVFLEFPEITRRGVLVLLVDLCPKLRMSEITEF
jgi:hypothetical protein